MAEKLMQFRWLNRRRQDLIDKHDCGNNEVVLQVRYRFMLVDYRGDIGAGMTWTKWQDMPTVDDHSNG